MKKILTIGIMLLFIGMIINPSTGKNLSFDDITPPVSTHSLDPPEPDGDNGYYVSNVTVTLNATDNESGVKEIRYRVDNGSWYIIYDNVGEFGLYEDGNDILIEYSAIDNAGNKESINAFNISIDQKQPILYTSHLTVILGGVWSILMLNAFINTSEMSGGLMDRIEFFINDGLIEIITGGGPDYNFVLQWSERFKGYTGWFYAYDRAGNMAIESVNFSDIESYSFSYNMFFSKLLERFPILNQLIVRILERWSI
jgi:hypothetical protein